MVTRKGERELAKRRAGWEAHRGQMTVFARYIDCTIWCVASPGRMLTAVCCEEFLSHRNRNAITPSD